MRSLYLIIFLCVFVSCIKITDPLDTTPGEKLTFLEGQQIPGTEIFFPLGFNDLESRPKVSPDGNFIVYQNQEYRVNPSAQPGLYILDLSTSTKRLLIAGTSVRNADWSPDGQWIAFNNGTHIYKIKANSDSLTQLTTQGRNFFPDWSPDGQWIAYDRSLPDHTGPAGVWLMKNDGSQKSPILGGASPDWHPSGEQLLVLRGVSAYSVWKKFFIYDLAIDSITNVLDAVKNQDNWDPEFSPDGSRITFRNPQGIWVMNADGTALKRIIPNHLYNASHSGKIKLWVDSPTWHPDGIHIVYEHFRIIRMRENGFGILTEGDYSIYMVNVDSAVTASILP